MNDLDRILDEALSTDRDPGPSPFFTARVMAAVRAEAQLPPLPFPFARFAAALALFLLILIRGALPEASSAADLLFGTGVVLVTVAALATLRAPRAQPPAS
jgi:hypothetical protein